MAIRKSLFLFSFTILSLVWVPAWASQAEDPIITIRLKAIAGLQYDQVRFQVKPGASIKLVLRNEDDMSHNLIITKPGGRVQVVNAALKLEEKGPEMNYIPASPDVLWTIPVLSPGEERSISFTAPKEPGVYPYVCTFPGHGFSMYGAMYVTIEEKLPDIKDDLNIPESRREPLKKGSADKTKGHDSHNSRVESGHPYELRPPYLYRAYMENASPAAIAVNLPHELSYCWDAGTCELRYAWEGGFVDNSGLWKGKPNAVARVLGRIFFESRARHPLRIGDPGDVPVAEYKGYKLINRYPEFHYTLDGVDVYELILPKEDGTGLIRKFRIPEGSKSIWLITDPKDGVVYDTPVGKWEKNRLMISAADARNFGIVMTIKED